MDGYDSPRVQYASPRRQLSRSGKKNTIARDLDTRTPRYSPPPPATPPPASPARRSPSPEAPSYTRRAVAAALRLAGHITKPIHGENGR